MAPEIILYAAGARGWLRFTEPVEIARAESPREVTPALRRIEQAVEHEGCWAAGFLAYEAAPGLDPALPAHAQEPDLPLLWFGLFSPPVSAELPEETETCPPVKWTPSVSAAAYAQGFEAIKKYIASGETYQVNYTHRLYGSMPADPRAFFGKLTDARCPGYGALVDYGGGVICSASPELLFTLDGEVLTSRPMKGTAPRAPDYASDVRRAAMLRDSDKERAENVMIVDMVRHDLGRIAETGTVTTPALFDVERYPSVWQMTSTVRGRTRASPSEIFGALFPAASVTGAPKRRTMEVIADLETSPRGIYCGSIGYLAPGRRAQFNVAIRTAHFPARDSRAVYGVGGGIVWDSDVDAEMAECRAKARVLEGKRPEFDLLETIRWCPGSGCVLLDRHLTRLRQSAQYFGYECDVDAVRRKLDEAAAGFGDVPMRVRLTMDVSGKVRLTARPLEPWPAAGVVLAPAPEPVDPDDPFLYHKTTRRAVYERASSGMPKGTEALLWNERGEVTETCIANVLFRFGARWVTPPVGSGLLAGTARGDLLDRGAADERVVTIEEARNADECRVINSVRGSAPARLEGPLGAVQG
ncbi:aminodeoxychorismate synthase component I [Kiritimatiella glycovorans]|uniref:Para-aminobenzoate synthase component 1 n=1 Tax=Kiritimatiella glycovorans TaxID=1307763 RepID=A0A0G3EE02_9BACT|nr:aminodeoxychorismate synthase component I [Kiritimatiella glycovorans]AKJ64538.1 Para-aminobenzoate synthase component 1 [Kiritimatiella glycovorans]